jgi:hypothetical protein
MAGVAAVLLHQHLATLHPRWIARVARRRGLRYFGDEIRKDAKIVVGQRLRHLVHRLEGTQLFAEHEKLDQRVRRLLAAERGRVLGLGLALFAVTGETWRDALFDGFGVGGCCNQHKRQCRYSLTHRPFPAFRPSGVMRSIEPRMRNCASGNLKIPGLVLTYHPEMTATRKDG